MMGKFSAKLCNTAFCLLRSMGFLLYSSNTSSGSLNWNGQNWQLSIRKQTKNGNIFVDAYLRGRTARLGEYGLEVRPQEADEYDVIDEQVHHSDFWGRDSAWKTKTVQWSHGVPGGDGRKSLSYAPGDETQKRKLSIGHHYCFNRPKAQIHFALLSFGNTKINCITLYNIVPITL